nr:hypothetical protein CFP56_21291 [Quercus suber]
MTRRIVYGISFWVFLGSAALTIAAIALPNWVSYRAPIDGRSSIGVSYGLHKRCSSITGQCTPFPQPEDCHGEDRFFCSMWRSTGFLMNFSLVMEVVCALAYVTVLVGGRSAREGGWKMVAGLLGLVAVGQLVAMALVAYLYDHDNRFFVGWELDKSWILCTVSWSVIAVNVVGLLSAVFFLPPEDDYETIEDPISIYLKANSLHAAMRSTLRGYHRAEFHLTICGGATRDMISYHMTRCVLVEAMPSLSRSLEVPVPGVARVGILS